MAEIAEATLAHHERMDGTGYPYGRRGQQIPFMARIVAVADAYDAMVSARPYRHAYSHSQALQELQRGAGKQFDAQVVKAFTDWHAEKSLESTLLGCNPIRIMETAAKRPPFFSSPFPSGFSPGYSVFRQSTHRRASASRKSLISSSICSFSVHTSTVMASPCKPTLSITGFSGS